MTGLNLGEIERILDERKGQLRELAERRDALQKQLDQVDREIQELIGDGRGLGNFKRKRKRVKNERSLRTLVLETLKANKKGFTLADLADKIKETGYKSNSRNFRNVLYQCLYNTEGIVHDDSTGCYKLTSRCEPLRGAHVV